jgi:hypothetical protein
LFSGRREHGPDDREVVGAGLDTKLWRSVRFNLSTSFVVSCQLHHAGIAFSLIVDEGDVPAVQKPQYVAPALIKAQEEIVTLPSRLAAVVFERDAARADADGRQNPSPRCVVAPLDTGDQSRDATIAGEIDGVGGPAPLFGPAR